MNKKIPVGNLKKITIGTIALVGACTISFNGLTQLAKAAVVNKTDIVPTAYSSTVNASKESAVPSGYVKAAYKIKLAESADNPTAKDMPAENAAELGAQDLWKIFNVNLSGKTIEMSYRAATSTQPRAEWSGNIIFDKKLSYNFTVDAVTGECRATSQLKFWSGNIDTKMDKALLKDPSQYISLAKETALKLQLVPGKITSAEYVSQGYTGSDNGKNPDITIMVKSDNGQQAQLTFSRYNRELLAVEYDSWLKDAKIMEQQIQKDMEKKMGSSTHVITEQDIKNIK